MESKYEGKECFDEEDLAKGFKDVVVVENENRRTKAISHFPKEVDQVCKDIANFFKVQSNDLDRKRAKQIDSLAGPQALRMLLSQVEPHAEDEEDGQVWFYEFKLLSPEKILELGLIDGLVPFAINIDEEMLACGEHDHKGGVYTINAEGEVEGDQEAVSLATYLEAYRDALLSNKLEFVEECGMIEKTPASPCKK